MSRRQHRKRALRRRAHMAVASGGLVAVATLGTGGVAHAAQTFAVTNLNDSGAGSLRAAIQAVDADTADTAPPGDSIVFASNLSGTLALTTAHDSFSSLYVDRPVQIEGPGANQLTIKGVPNHHVIHFTSVAAGVTNVTKMAAKVSGLTISGGGGSALNDGGGVHAYGTALELDGVAVTGNTAQYVGGVDVFGPGSTLTMNNSTVSGNTATNPQATGGIYSDYATTVNDSTITGNTGGYGGAGIAVYKGALTITGSTVAGNTLTKPTGGQVQSVEGTVTLDDSIVSGSGTIPDVALDSKASGTASFSLIRNASGISGGLAISTNATDITGNDPQLGALQSNGGPTQTMLPTPTSPVLDHGKSFGLTTDQRGLPRPVALSGITSVPAGGDRSDIGAVEVQAPAITSVSPPSGGAGTHVTINGVTFTGATQVLFGAIPASSFTVLNDGAISAVAPANVETQDVRVITPLGETSALASDRFTFPTFRPTISRSLPKLHGKKLNTGVRVGCPSGGLGCAGRFKATAVIAHHKTKLAEGQFDLAAGQNDTITFNLPRKALNALKHAGKLKITVLVVIADGTELPVTVTEKIEVKHKKP